MTAVSAIEWTDSTFNPWIGCTKVSPGCDSCYAEKVGQRMQVKWGAGHLRKRTSVSNWREVERWNARATKEGRRHLVFCASLADVFDNEVPVQWRADLFDLIHYTPALTWLLLTKRVGNVARMVPEVRDGPLPPNVWLGISIVNQEEAERDIPKLLATPAAKRFVSYEPALGPVQFDRLSEAMDAVLVDALRGVTLGPFGGCERLDWVIVGGESGPKARPFDVAWARSTVEQCRQAGVPVFVKQLGAHVLWNGCSSPGEHWPAGTVKNDTGNGNWRVQLCDPKGGDINEWPEDLRVRQWPNT